MALDVLIRILDPRHAENNDQWKEDESRRDGSEFGEELKDGDDSKESERKIASSERSEEEARGRKGLTD